MNAKYITLAFFLALACAPQDNAIRYVDAGGLNIPDDSWEPTAVAVGANGYVYVVDSSLNCAVQVFDPDRIYLGSIGGLGKAPGELFVPVDVAVGPSGNIYVAEFGTHRISIFRPDGTFIKAVGEGDLLAPFGVAVASDGRIYVADAEAGGLLTFSREGALVETWGEDRATSHVLDVAVAPDGGVAYAPGDAGEILLVTARSSNPLRFAINGNPTSVPNEIAFGPRGKLLVLGQRTEAGGTLENFVALLSPRGELREEVPLSLTTPTGLAAGPDGAIYVADGPRHEVRIYRPTRRTRNNNGPA